MADHTKNKHYRYLEKMQRQMAVDDEEDQKLYDAIDWVLDQINPDRVEQKAKKVAAAKKIATHKLSPKGTAVPILRLIKND